MITQETAGRIWECYREIAAGEKLLADIAEAAKDYDHDDPRHEKLQDAFGRVRDLQLGVPSGHGAHRLFNVAPDLAKSVIRAHIANKQAELAEANEQARLELNGNLRGGGGKRGARQIIHRRSDPETFTFDERGEHETAERRNLDQL